MIILTDKDFFGTCGCGCTFVANEHDMRPDLGFTNRLFVGCPKCGEKQFIIVDKYDTIEPIIEGEKVNENISEMQRTSD